MGREPDRHVTLAVPGLLGPRVPQQRQAEQAVRALTDGLTLDALGRFFARCRNMDATPPEGGLTALLFACFGITRQESDWPVAALTRRLDGGPADDAWVLRADPVHLHAGMGELTLTDSRALNLTSEEAAALVAGLNAELDEPGLHLEPLAPTRWYLSLEHAPSLVTRAPWDAVGADVGEYLPIGDDGARWRAFMNDAQMILHASPVNRDRERRGVPVINSLWLWGGGRMPRAPGGRWAGVWSDMPLVKALADLDEATLHAPGANAHGWLTEAAHPGRHLVVLDSGYLPARCADVEAWRDFVTHLDRDWMAPLLDALRSGRLASLAMASDDSTGWHLERRGLRRWWRRRRPLAQMMLAERRSG